jgi:hypothetical protein
MGRGLVWFDGTVRRGGDFDALCVGESTALARDAVGGRMSTALGGDSKDDELRERRFCCLSSFIWCSSGLYSTVLDDMVRLCMPRLCVLVGAGVLIPEEP